MQSHTTIILLLIPLLTFAYPLYNLYQSPTTFPNFTKNGLGNKANINKILTPQQSDLIITIQSNDLLKLITISFYKIDHKSILLLHQSYKKIMYELEFIDAFWINNQYLLIIGPTRKIFFRPPINGHEESFTQKLEYSITFAGVVSENEGSQFTTMNTNFNKWVLHRYAVTQNSSSLIKKIPLCNIQLLETPVQMIRTKDFQCVLFEKIYTLEKPQVYHRFQCLHLNSSIIDEYQVQEKDEIKAKVDYDRNTLYTLGGLILGEIVRYQLLLIDKKIQFKKQKLFAGLRDIRDLSINQDIMTLYMVNLTDVQRSYFIIISTSNIQKPYVYQYYGVERSKYPVGMMKLSSRDKELFIIAPTVLNNANTQYDLIYTSQIEYQVEYQFIWGLMMAAMVLFMVVSFSILRHFSLYRQICLIEGRLKSTLLQLLVIILLHTSIFFMVISTDVSYSTNFTNKPLMSTSLQSYTLRIYNFLFLYTTLTSVIFQTCSQYNTKSRYLNVLLKHGLDLKTYFFTKQHIILLKAFVYSILSVSLIVLLDSIYPNEIARLYPTMQQILAVSFAYFVCLFITYNMNWLVLYFFNSYWMYLTVSLSINFLISFSNGQFYLNSVFISQQYFLAILSPLQLFSAATQHIFKTEVRFNQGISTFFLFGTMLAQLAIAFGLYKIYLTVYFKKTSFQQLISQNEIIQNFVINSSLQADSFSSIKSQQNKDLSDNILLDAFIPCKLSKNQGFQKNNILKDIYFTGSKGSIITFLDSVNTSKPMLFKILINDQKSDSHIEKDLSGKVCYTKPVKISYSLNNQLYFKQLTIYEHLQLFSIIKSPKSPKSKHKEEIEFLLNQFNIPEQYWTKKARQLSGGYLKKMCLACAFIGDPDVVIIDQPTLGLDNRFRGLFYQKLKQWKQNKLIIVGTSDNAQAEAISDKIWILQKSKMIDSSLERQKKHMTLLRLYFLVQADFARAQNILKVNLKKIECNHPSFVQ